MKAIWRIIVVIWLLAWGIIGFGMYLIAPRQIEKDSDFKTQRLDPLVDAVKSFVISNKRVPTDHEFDRLNTNSDGELITSYIGLPDEFADKIEVADWDSDTYAIIIWRGDWNEGYISKNEIYI